jgi:hypothetical protein
MVARANAPLLHALSAVHDNKTAPKAARAALHALKNNIHLGMLAVPCPWGRARETSTRRKERHATARAMMNALHKHRR